MSDDDLIPVEDALVDLDESFLLCRDVHHSWTVSKYASGGGGGIERVLECARCGTERVDVWTLSGARISAHYRYPDGYQFRHVEDAGDRTALRREVLRRAGVSTGGRRRRRA